MAKTTLRVVLDPTVLVEALLDRDGGSARLLRAATSRELRLVWSEELRVRFEAALLEEEVRRAGSWSEEDARRLLDGLELLAVEVDHDDDVPGSGDGTGAAADGIYFELAFRAAAVVASTDPATLARSGHLGVEVLRPETVVAALSSL